MADCWTLVTCFLLYRACSNILWGHMQIWSVLLWPPQTICRDKKQMLKQLPWCYTVLLPLFSLSLPPVIYTYIYINTYTNTQTHIFFFLEVRLLGFKMNISVQMVTINVLFMQHNKNQKIIHPFIVNVIIKLSDRKATISVAKQKGEKRFCKKSVIKWHTIMNHCIDVFQLYI